MEDHQANDNLHYTTNKQYYVFFDNKNLVYKNMIVHRILLNYLCQFALFFLIAFFIFYPIYGFTDYELNTLSTYIPVPDNSLYDCICMSVVTTVNCLEYASFLCLLICNCLT